MLTGEYGTGKSKCIEHIYNSLAKGAWTDLKFPVAIDLRKCWGLRDRYEIIRRHLQDLNIAAHSEAFIRAYNAACCSYCLTDLMKWACSFGATTLALFRLYDLMRLLASETWLAAKKMAFSSAGVIIILTVTMSFSLRSAWQILLSRS